MVKVLITDYKAPTLRFMALQVGTVVVVRLLAGLVLVIVVTNRVATIVMMAKRQAIKLVVVEVL